MTPNILLVFLLLSPVLIILLTEKSKIANQIGSILIAYALGVLLGNINILPSQSSFLSSYLSGHSNISLADIEYLVEKGIIPSTDLAAFKIFRIQDFLMALSIPPALFSLNIRSWFHMAGKTLLAMLLGIGALMVVIVFVDLIYRPRIPEMDKIVGMLTGLYTGGTPNLAALKMMLNIDVDTYIKVHTYDMVPSVLYLFFLMSFGKNLFRKFLGKYPVKNGSGAENTKYEENTYKGIFTRRILIPLLAALGLAVLIFGISGILSLAVGKDKQMLVVILTITTLSILAAMIPRINKIAKTFEAGMYFILLFSVTVASMADVNRLVNISADLFSAITVTIFATLVLHTLLCKIFRIDGDTMVITSTALVCSPPFVPPVAGALKNREVIIGGLTVGIIGYAVGNYLGVLVTFIL
jgi:uncharacterized membrane protein